MKVTIFFIPYMLFVPLAAHAQSSVSTTQFTLPTSLNEIVQKLPRPLTDFVNSLYSWSAPFGFGPAFSLGTSAWMPHYGIPSIPQDVSAGSLFDFVKQLILFIGGFLVVILRVIASVIEWVISFISRGFSS